MRKFKMLCILLSLALCSAGCAPQNNDTGKTGGSAEIADASEKKTETEESGATEGGTTDGEITDISALAAVKNYCYQRDPDLKEGAENGDYNVSWDIDSRNADEVVIIYYSYTSAEVRYYIDRASGETYITEFMPGLSDEETRTDESFNVRDYISGD